MSEETPTQDRAIQTADERPGAITPWQERAVSIPVQNGLVVPQNLSQLHDYAAVLVKSGPMKDFNVPDAVLALQRGVELGFSLTVSTKVFYPAPKGQLGIYVEAALALLRGRRVLEGDRIEWTGTGEDLTATWHFRRSDWPEGRWEKRSFSLRQARQAQLIKHDGNWQKWPDRMTAARVIGFAIKDYFSDHLYGFEVGADFRDRSPVGPPPETVEVVPTEPVGEDPLKAMALDEEPLEAELVEEPEPPSDEARLLRLTTEATERAGADKAARNDLLRELSKVVDGQGLDAAEKWLIEHPAFGGPIQGTL